MGERIAAEARSAAAGGRERLETDVQIAADTLHDVDESLRVQGINPADVPPAVGHVSFKDVLTTLDDALAPDTTPGGQQ